MPPQCAKAPQAHLDDSSLQVCLLTLLLPLDGYNIAGLFFFFDSGQTTSFWPLWIQNDVVWISDFQNNVILASLILKPNQNNVVWVRFEITCPNNVVLEPKRPKRRRLAIVKKKKKKACNATTVEKKNEEKEEEAAAKGGAEEEEEGSRKHTWELPKKRIVPNLLYKKKRRKNPKKNQDIAKKLRKISITIGNQHKNLIIFNKNMCNIGCALDKKNPRLKVPRGLCVLVRLAPFITMIKTRKVEYRLFPNLPHLISC